MVEIPQVNPNTIRMANLKKIAIFMGYRYDPHNEWSGTWFRNTGSSWVVKGSIEHESKTTLNYNADWGILMEVWERIAAMRKASTQKSDYSEHNLVPEMCPTIDEMTIGPVGCLIRARIGKEKFTAFNVIGDKLRARDGIFTLIQATYTTILEFVDWYNDVFLPIKNTEKRFDL